MTQQAEGGSGWAALIAEAGDSAAFDEATASSRAIPMIDDRLDSKDLFASGRLITIAHGEQTYQLRLTAQNKLILTK